MPRPPTIEVEWNDGATVASSGNAGAVDDMFDACTSFSQAKVYFPANSNSDCATSIDPDCGTDGLCKPCAELAEAHDSCHDFRDVTFSTDSLGTISTSFRATVALTLTLTLTLTRTLTLTLTLTPNP